MQVTVETTSNLGRKLNITVPSEQIEAKISKKLKEISSQVKIDGFRPGKVPFKVVQQRFGKAAHDEIINEVLQHTLFEAISNEKLKPAGMPEVQAIKAEPGNPLEYTVAFDVYPEITLADFATLKAEKITAEIIDSDVDEMLESIRKQRAEWKAVERASKIEDQMIIDFEGFLDDKPFPGGNAENLKLVLGSKSFIPGFEDGLLSKKAGDEVELNITFPEDYHEKDLAGKPVKFNVKVKEVQEPELPALDETFVKAMGVESGNLEEFKTQVKEHMQRELQQAVKSRQKSDLFNALLETHKFEIPTSLVKSEIKAMLKQYMPKHEPTHEQIEHVPDALKQEAEKRVAIGLIVMEIIQAHDIKVDQDKVKEYIEEMAQAYEHPAEMVSWYYRDKERLAGVESLILEQQVFDKLCESAQIQDKKLSYSEVMKPEKK